jgi:hypothetical protein
MGALNGAEAGNHYGDEDPGAQTVAREPGQRTAAILGSNRGSNAVRLEAFRANIPAKEPDTLWTAPIMEL